MEGRKFRKPKENGSWNLIAIAPYLAVWFGLCSFLGFAFSGTFLVGGLAFIAGVVSLVLMVICLIIWLYSKKDKFFSFGNTNEFDRAIRNIDGFLYANNLFVNDSHDSGLVQLPRVKLTNRGFKIQALGGLRKRLLSADTLDELQAYLDNSRASVFIRASYYSDGWVYFIIGKDIVNDRLHF